MSLCSIDEALAEIRRGRMIILVDDEDRENEGDLTMAAEFVTPEAINFMATHGRGLICLPMAPEMIDRLNLPLMAQRNGSRFGTNFTISIEAREGVTTGISAADRATTILAAVADKARPEDLVTPGHVFPLRARGGGVLSRTGQTEGGVDLAKLAGLKPAAVICEIMKDDGTMARMPDLEIFAEKHGLPFILLSDPELQAIQAYGVWQEKKLYDKVSMGVVRTTYIIDENGVVEAVMPKVKPDTNAAEILVYLG